jgi:putative hemolysin
MAIMCLYKLGRLFAVLLALVMLSAPVAALVNPASVYCSAMGYTYAIDHTPAGDIATCILPGGNVVDAWRFLQGSEGSEYGYCAKQGYAQKIVQDPGICAVFLTETCAVCLLADGREVEVTRAMNLSFDETACGDGSCGFPEDSLSCPQDCPSGGYDEYCDGIRDGRCDPDCLQGTGDPDCPLATGTINEVPTEKSPLPLILPLLALILGVLAAARWMKRS